MKIIFIRHGDPDYANDTLTEKGHREARLLAERVSRFKNIKEIYVSPLGRAQKTAEYSLKALGMKAETKDWLREFAIEVKRPDGIERKKHIPWDYLPSYWTNEPLMYDKDNWYKVGAFEGVAIKEYYDEVTTGLDEILEKNGYKRHNNVYMTDTVNGSYPVIESSTQLVNTPNEPIILFFCHLGVSFVCISHLLGIAPTVLWHDFFVAPTALMILGSEEREPGIAAFRVQSFGDTSHLTYNGEPVSPSGSFTGTFQG